MDLNFSESRFTSADIMDVLQVSAANVQTWANRGIIRPVDPNPGLGNRRLYSASDVVAFALTQDLAGWGISVKRAGEIAQDVVRLIPQFMGGDRIPNCELAKWMPFCEGGWHLWFVVTKVGGEYHAVPPCDDLGSLAETIGSAGVPFCGCLDVRSALELVVPKLRERLGA